MFRTERVQLYPNNHMARVLDELCDYRRFCWNSALAVWNSMYDAYTIDPVNPRPNGYSVRNELVANKGDWQYALSSRTLQLAVIDLGQAWQSYWDKAQPDWGRPKFKSKKASRQGFKTDRAQIIEGKLRLDHPEMAPGFETIAMRGYRDLSGELKLVCVVRECGKYWATLIFARTVMALPLTGRNTAVDLNVGHINFTDGKIDTLTKRLVFLYSRVRFYQRQLDRKQIVNGPKADRYRNYVVTKAKLQRDYRRIVDIQHDLIQKFTTRLVSDYDVIVIENLAVKTM